jgi:hypothetical protein
MMRHICAILLILALASATIDQRYLQTFSADGSSTIEKYMEVSIFASQLPDASLERMSQFCAASSKINCSVDIKNKTIVVSERFGTGGYYSSETDYGLPFITQTVSIERIPNDRFGSTLEIILSSADITGAESGTVSALNLRDKSNQETAMYLKKFKANLSYTVVMPAAVFSASAGNYSAQIDGQYARFDLLKVLDQSQPMRIASREINSAAIVAIIGLIVLAALALTFFGSKRGAKPKHK